MKNALSKEERKLIRQAEKEEKKRLLDLRIAEKRIKVPKPKKTEAELVRQYADIIISKQRTRGQIVDDKFKPNKDLWQDADFFFSIVFQSREQKYQFLEFIQEKFGVWPDDQWNSSIQIVNGLKLAESMGLVVKKEIASDFPCGNLELRDFVLDEEKG